MKLLDPRIVAPLLELPPERFPTIEEPGTWDASAEAGDLDAAARRRALARYPSPAGPPEDRHVLAGRLVRALATGVWPFSEEIPPPVRFAKALAILEYFLGLRLDETGTNGISFTGESPPELHRQAVDLAIDLLCDDRPPSEIVAGAAAWLLLKFGGGRSGSWATARARRLCSSVGVRFPRRPDVEAGVRGGKLHGRVGPDHPGGLS